MTRTPYGDIARFFLSFTRASWGNAFPAVGTNNARNFDPHHPGPRAKEMSKALEIAKAVKRSSLCGLGQTCPNPVISTIQQFRHEYDAHIEDKRCPAAACDAMVISACQHTCPAGIDIPTYVSYIAEGKYIEATAVIRERNPFPAICGRVCHHPCERKCRRGEVDEPVSIRVLKRFAADWYFKYVEAPPAPFPVTKKEKVAVVGAGTGLMAIIRRWATGHGF